jgi:hypothetical protein
MSAQEWTATSDPERWSGARRWPTREAAIAGAPRELFLEPGARYSVGRVEELEPATLVAEMRVDGLARDVSERVVEAAVDLLGGEVVGQLGERWPSDDAQRALGDSLRCAISEWLSAYADLPDWWLAVDVTDHVAP